MKSLEQYKSDWKDSAASEVILEQHELKQMISGKIRREKRIFFEYFWTSYAWQFFIYVSLTRLIILFWGDWTAVSLFLTGIVVYIPFSTLLIRKFISWATRSGSDENVKSRLENQFNRMSEFFQFKKIFDWVGVPLSSFLITFIVFKLWVPGDWTLHPMGALFTFGFTLIIFLVVTFDENKRKFKNPLHKLELVLKEFQEEK